MVERASNTKMGGREMHFLDIPPPCCPSPPQAITVNLEEMTHDILGRRK